MSRALGDREDTYKAYNQTGSDINYNRLVHCVSWVDAAGVPSIRYASADGTRNLADGILVSPSGQAALPTNRTGRVYTDYVLENVNTAGTTVNDDVFTDPTTPGTWTFTRPTTSGQDVQVVGRVLTVSATVGRIAFGFSPMSNGGLAGGMISSLALEDKPYHFLGHTGIGWVRIANSVTDGDRISINGRIYEFDTAAPPGAIGAGANVRVGVSGGGGDQANTAAGCQAALVAAINADASRVVDGITLGGNGHVGVTARAIGTAGNYALVDTIDAGNVITVSAATLVSGAAKTPQRKVERAYTVQAADVTALAATLGTSEVPIMVFPSTSQPVFFGARARTAAGRVLDLDGAAFTVRQAGAGFWAVCMAENAAGAILSAGDVVFADLQLAS